MQYLMQLGIILAVSFAGEVLNALLPLPVPASVYGLCLMLALLATGVLKPAQIQPVSRFLIAVMPVMFLPTCVGIMDVADQLLPVLLPFLVVCIVGSALVMVVSGCVAQAAIRRERGARQ